MGRRTLVLVIAVALAVISGYAVWQYLSSVGDDAAAEYSEVEVYRATEDIASGTAGEDAAVMIETSSALRNQVVFEGQAGHARDGRALAQAEDRVPHQAGVHVPRGQAVADGHESRGGVRGTGIIDLVRGIRRGLQRAPRQQESQQERKHCD